MDDDKLVKYQSQVKQRKLCRAVFILAFTLSASVIGFSFSPSTSPLVTTASKYHPKVKDIHRRLNTAAHHHLNKAHVHLKNHHWSASTATKLRGNAANFLHLHHGNHHRRTGTLDKQAGKKPITTEDAKKEVVSDTNEEQDVVADTAAASASQQAQEPIARE